MFPYKLTRNFNHLKVSAWEIHFRIPLESHLQIFLKKIKRWIISRFLNLSPLLTNLGDQLNKIVWKYSVNSSFKKLCTITQENTIENNLSRFPLTLLNFIFGSDSGLWIPFHTQKAEHFSVMITKHMRGFRGCFWD